MVLRMVGGDERDPWVLDAAQVRGRRTEFESLG
jgi:hypothetical protein